MGAKIKRPVFAIGMKIQVVIGYLFLIVVPFLLLSWLSIDIMYNYTCKIYGEYLVTNLTTTQEQLRVVFNRYRDISMSLYLNRTVERLDQTSLTEKELERIQLELDNMCNANAGLTSVWMEVNENVVFAGALNTVITDYVNSYRDQVIEEGGRIMWLPQSFYFPYPSGTNKYIIARALNTPNKENIGMMYMTVDKNVLDGAFGTVNITDAITYIVEPSYTILYSSNAEKLNQKFTYLQLNDEEKNGFRTEIVDGTNCLVAYARSDKTNWTQVAIVPVHSLLSNFTPVQVAIVLIVSIYVLLVLFFLILINRHLIKPISYLTHVMDLFADDTLQVSPEEKYRAKEVNSLFIHFNSMTQKVQGLIEENKKVEREKSDFEKQVLVSQMNPHFIYNSLNTVKWLAVIHKQSVIKNVTDSLIYILMQITNKSHSTHSIQDEIKLLEHYAVIQKTRFMNFDIHYDISPETINLFVRKFLFHTIVENAIIHGFSGGKITDGQIFLTTCIKDEQLHIEIKDNGKGFDINKWENQIEPTNKYHTNIGIKNIQQIINLEYGEPFGLSIESELGKGTCVHFVLPVIEKEDEII